MPPVLITGAAGFIGFHLARRMLADGHQVVGLDNLNTYYDVRLKHARLAMLKEQPGFTFVHQDLVDGPGLMTLFQRHGFCRVVNLAAQAGVRHSLTHPHPYVDSNITGFLNILEACRHNAVEHLVYASSSSVYGANTTHPLTEHQPVGHPLSLYAASKRANELMAHSYSHLFGLPVTGTRFFTVYGPWGRPDMALYIFAEAIRAGRPIQIFNHGRMQRDFTYVDDVVESLVRLLDHPPVGKDDWTGQSPDPASSRAPFAVYNVGRGSPCDLLDYVGLLEEALGKKAEMELLPMQPGDVAATWADCSDLEALVGYRPQTSVREGVAAFVRWFEEFEPLGGAGDAGSDPG